MDLIITLLKIRRYLVGLFAGIIEALQGYKTYILAIGTICTAVVAFLNGVITLEQLIEAVWTSILGMTIRAGISKSGPPAKSGLGEEYVVRQPSRAGLGEVAPGPRTPPTE